MNASLALLLRAVSISTLMTKKLLLIDPMAFQRPLTDGLRETLEEAIKNGAWSPHPTSAELGDGRSSQLPWFVAARADRVDWLEFLRPLGQTDAKNTLANRASATALMLAAEAGALNSIAYLLDTEDAGYPYLLDVQGRNAFMIAAAAGHTQAAQLLAPASDPSSPNKQGQNAFLMAIEALCPIEHLKAIEPLVADASWDETREEDFRDNRKQDPLMTAAAKGHQEAVEFLLPRANPQTRNAYGETALFLAALAGFPECVRLLLPHANLNDETHVADNGNSPLFAASLSGAVECVAMLAEAMTTERAQAKNLAGLDALDAAVRGGSPECAELISPFFPLADVLSKTAHFDLSLMPRLAARVEAEALRTVVEAASAQSSALLSPATPHDRNAARLPFSNSAPVAHGSRRL